MLLREILKLRSSEIAVKVYFASCFCIFKAFGQPSHGERGTLPELLKSGGARASCAPVPMSMPYTFVRRVNAC